MNWERLYEQASASFQTSAGYYNHNIRIDTSDGPVNVRIPIDGAEIMDLRIWDEVDLLPIVSAYYDYSPRLLYASRDPLFQVHEFINGDQLNNLAPRGTPLPRYVLGDIADLLTRLTQIPRARLPALPPNWPEDTQGFARRLSDLTRQVYDRCRDEYARHYAAFGVPSDPLATVVDNWGSLTPRPAVLVHADIHRKNIIVHHGESFFLDWELALWGDPVYDIAVHIHKMGYLLDEREEFLRLWAAALPERYTTGWQHDLDVYVAHEQVKSAVVDIVRYSQIFSSPGPAHEPRSELVHKLTGKLTNAHTRWGTDRTLSEADVDASLRELAGTSPS
jgi:hypothetical protein